MIAIMMIIVRTIPSARYLGKRISQLMNHHQANALGIKPVDPASPIPLYQQIRLDLIGMLQSGKIKPGDMLPTEKELTAAYQVSRHTIRQALALLDSQNLVERIAGRGTIVTTGKSQHTFFLDQSFAQQLIEMGLTPRSEILRKRQTVIAGTTPQSLLSKRGSAALELIRLRFGNDIPIGIQYTTVITDLCPDLHTHDFRERSLYDLLQNHYKIPISRIDQSVRAVLSDEWHTKLLLIHEFSPLLCVHTTAFLDNEEPIETSTSYYRADKYEFSISQNY